MDPAQSTVMSSFLGWALAVLIGHFGLHLAIYNRVNSFGLPRRSIKAIVKFFFATSLLIPPLVVVAYPGVIGDLLAGTATSIPIAVRVYGSICLASWIFLGIPWLMWRPIFGLEAVAAPRRVERVEVERAVGRSLALTASCRFESRLPMNQIFDLAIESIELPVVGLPSALDGYRIAHLSDIHLTGDVHPEYARYAVARASGWQPDLMALTGDIIDKQPCIDWLPEIFSQAGAADGCYFVLGNHDTRVVDSWQTRDAMDRAGWTDLGSRYLCTDLRGVSSLVIGNEHPWFERPNMEGADAVEFRLMLSHSPDQLSWARRHNITLMLAGHTHGGQGRLPLAGPLLSPSYHGSRYASGDFYKTPTTMHVTRGLGGVHLMRINCRPELSLITLRTC
jgi:predicted MPP superfamily phosphohydrolase